MRILCILTLLLPAIVHGQEWPLLDEAPGAEHTVATWSIIARDPATGQIGIAVQSRAFRAGRTVPYAEPGVGLVATQSGAANTNYGRKAMEWLKEGMAPQAIVDRLVREDPTPGGRQVTVIDNRGRIAVYTGPDCGVWAGHLIGDQYSAQGNILAGPQVVEATFKAFGESKGDLADRLLTALEAGQVVGGDARGMQAGAVWVIEGQPDPNGSERYRGVDIRVDDAPNPFAELRRLLNIVYSGRQTQLSTGFADQGRHREAIEAQRRAIELNPAGDQLVYTLAQRYAQAGEVDRAIETLARAIEMHPRWREAARTQANFDVIRAHAEFGRLVGAQTSPGSAALPGLSAITAADLRRDLFTLAGDSMHGRLGGTLDEMRASMWLAERAREIGLEPAGDDGTYFQFFPIGRVTQSKGSRVVVGGDTLRIARDFVVTALQEGDVDAPAVWVDDVSPATLQRSGVAGKIVFAPVRLADSVAPLRAGAPIRQSEEGRRADAGVAATALALRNAGAAAAILVADARVEANFDLLGFAASFGRYSRDTMQVAPVVLPAGGQAGAGSAGGPPPIPVAVLRSATRARVAAATRAQLSLSVDRFVYPSVNVVAVVPGTDPALRGEYVLYSSHQDHDGIRNAIDGDAIRNGADDNATTSVALLAIGRAIERTPSKRSSLFVWHGAEERGLMGSRWYAVHPTVPKGSIAAVLNGDMIGRNHPDTAALLGALPPHRNSTAFVDMALAANAVVSRFVIDSSWDRQEHPEGWYFRSDHLPYACAGIPALFFTTLLHSDYHTPQDEPDRIDIAKLQRMTQWMYATGWAVGNAAVRPAVDPGFKLERPCAT